MWKSLRTTKLIGSLNRKFRRHAKTQASLSTEESPLTLLCGLIALGQIRMRRMDGHQRAGELIADAELTAVSRVSEIGRYAAMAFPTQATLCSQLNAWLGSVRQSPRESRRIRFREAPLTTRDIIAVSSALILLSCASPGHRQFYSQSAPTKYPPTSRLRIFEYQNVDLQEVYELLFADFLVIGRSSFDGPYENPEKSASFAKSIGTDVFISTSQFKETRTSFVTVSIPTASTTYVSGYSGSGSFYGTATTYGTQQTTVPIQVNRYDQNGYFLRNVNNVVPLWERSVEQYEKTGQSELGGKWFNENYQVDSFVSGEQLVAFIANDRWDRPGWAPGQLKFIYGVNSGSGVYLMGNKAPMPATFKVNRFGHLEVSLIGGGETFSFARVQ